VRVEWLEEKVAASRILWKAGWGLVDIAHAVSKPIKWVKDVLGQ
jgi:hypothetical protein